MTKTGVMTVSVVSESGFGHIVARRDEIERDA
jgi:hypothetical protein